MHVDSYCPTRDVNPLIHDLLDSLESGPSLFFLILDPVPGLKDQYANGMGNQVNPMGFPDEKEGVYIFHLYSMVLNFQGDLYIFFEAREANLILVY